jgi:uncharacterized membrane protein
MTKLVVIVFPTEAKAEEVRQKLLDMRATSHLKVRQQLNR